MAKRKKSSAKRRTPAKKTKRAPARRKSSAKRRPKRAPDAKRRASGRARAPKGRAPAGAVRALVAGKLPAPIYGVPREKVGTTVQRFIDWDGVSELSVLEEGLGTFQVTPLA